MEQQTQRLQQQVHRLAQQTVDRRRQRLDHLSARLSAASPDQILKRGFAMIESNGQIVTAGAELSADQTIGIRLHDYEAHPIRARILDQ